MTASQPNLLQLAKQGDPKAITALINQKLISKGIIVKATLEGNYLNIVLEATEVPDQKILFEFVRKGIVGLDIQAFERVKVYGKKIGQPSFVWIQEFELIAKSSPPLSPNQSAHKPVTNNISNESSNSRPKMQKHVVSKTSSISSLKQSSMIGNLAFLGLALVAIILTFFGWWTASIVVGASAIFAYYSLTEEGSESIAKVKSTNQGLSTAFSSSQIASYQVELTKKNLLSKGESTIFNQLATYKGGIPGYLQPLGKPGYGFVLSNSFVFYDKSISWKLPYENIIEAKLDFFQMSGIRGVLAAGNVARQMQQTKNILEIIYFDGKHTERSVKFQIHGALTIPGEAGKATEFLNYLLEFKHSFANKLTSNDSDPIHRLEKLKKLKDKGIITSSEFEAKKQELLEKL